MTNEKKEAKKYRRELMGNLLENFEKFQKRNGSNMSATEIMWHRHAIEATLQDCTIEELKLLSSNIN